MVDEFESVGSLAAISPQTTEHCQKTRENLDLTFPLLSDQGNKVAKEFNLVYEFPDQLKDVYRNLDIILPEYNGDDSWEMTLPARYVVDRSGSIVDAVMFVDHSQRAEPSETIEIMQAHA